MHGNRRATVYVPTFVFEWLTQRVDPAIGLKTPNRVAAAVIQAVVKDDLEAHREAQASHV